MARGKVRFKARFFVVLLGIVGVIGLTVFLILAGSKKGDIKFGSIDSELEVSAAIIRDETVVMTETYEKVNFNVVEGQTVNTGELIAEVYKRGYQDETMVTLLNLQKQIYAYQLQQLGGSIPPELADVNERIASVEEQIRTVSRDESDLDMLTLEQTLKNLQSERSTLLQTLVTADSTLTGYYNQLGAQQKAQQDWKHDIVNNAGSGIVSFYFDGYEQVLSINKLSTINAALVSSVVRGGNTSSAADSSSQTPLYRIINNTHWYLTFVTKATEPMRLAAGEQYTVQFTDYSDQMYTATALETVLSEDSVVNVLEFNTDIGNLIGVRTVAIKVQKSAQGLVVPIDAITMVNGVAGINIEYGDMPLRVEVDILAMDGNRAVIRARNDADTLAAGQEYLKP